MRTTKILRRSVLALLTLALHAARVSAQPASVASLRGNYVLTEVQAAGSAALGLLSFDGQGNVSGTEDVSGIPGCALGTPVTGTYSVNSDGTGALNLSPCSINGGTVEVFITPIDFVLRTFKGAAADGFLVMPGNSFATATLRRRPGKSSGYSLAALAPGAYSLSFRGYINGPEAGVGTLTSDGLGNATVSETWINGGALCTTTTNGTYSVNRDGSGVLHTPFAAQSCNVPPFGPGFVPTWDFVFDRSGGGAVDLISEQPNAGVLGKLHRMTN
jgi:hypothetical protein